MRTHAGSLACTEAFRNANASVSGATSFGYAWFAALAIESGCEWITMDHDYARFSGLRWRLPE